MARAKSADQATDTGTIELEVAGIYAFVETHTNARIDALKSDLTKSLQEALSLETKKVEERALKDIQAQAEKVRDQVLTALGLFAALFSILSASSLVLTRSSTTPELVLILCVVSLTLLIFLALFFAFLHNRIPEIKVIWLPLIFFVGLMCAMYWAISSMPATTRVTPNSNEVRAGPTK